MKKRYVKDLFINQRWYVLLGSMVIVLFVSFFASLLLQPVLIVVGLILLLTIVDYALLFFTRRGITGARIAPPRFSLGDENTVKVTLINSYPFRAGLAIIDELPIQFQERNFIRHTTVGISRKVNIAYTLQPLTRGEYEFGHLVVFVKSPIGLLSRRFRLLEPTIVKVYPSFLQLKKYQLMAFSDHLFTGIKKVRRLGHSIEFEKIKDYVQGDDIRSINWKATARSSNLMVNTYTETRQQQIYCIIDKGRAMKMPFEGMTLLDYSINAALALSNTALLRQDKAGLITFANKLDDIIVADRRNNQLHRLIEALYKQQTEFKESDYERLASTIFRSLNQRSLLLLFTNFETYASLERQLPYLRQIASRHLLCVVFFQNTLLEEIQQKQPDNTEGIYIKTIAEQFGFERRQIVKELRRYGILSILSTPQNLSVDVINKYLELKARQMV